MNRVRHKTEGAPRSSETWWITTTVALLAIAVFTVSGSQVVPMIIGSAAHGRPVDQDLITAFLLNIALILFAWRRSAQLKEAFAERDAAEAHVESLAYRDEVTGLANRRRLNEVLAELCVQKTRDAALLLIDLDHFKKINDLYGHAVGDELLSVVASRLIDASPPDAICFRQGGDEFAVLLCDHSADAAKAERLAHTVQTEISKPIRVSSIVTAVGTSIGIAVLTTRCKVPGDLLKRADLAMYEAKRLGRNQSVCFSPSMERELNERTQLEAEMRAGIEAGDFIPYFQPILDLSTGETRGFEVLARWQHPERGLIGPPEFMAVAEASGMISELSFSVMREALRKAHSWPSRFTLAVNVSPVQFNDPLLAQRILQLLALTGFPAARLELEIMEKSLLGDQSLALSTITSLRNSGISISVDDFGTGYALLTELKALPFDRIKLDRRFMRSLIDDQQCDALVRAVSSLGKGLKLPITAEGVESEAVHSKLAGLGCTDAQGWLFAEALSADEVALGFLDKPATQAATPVKPSPGRFQNSGPFAPPTSAKVLAGGRKK